jgi:hypothetical protein
MEGMDAGITISVSRKDRVKLFLVLLLFLSSFHLCAAVCDANKYPQEKLSSIIHNLQSE